jgi:signal peptidase I
MRAAWGAAAVVQRKMSRGLSVLNTVAYTAPLVGLYGTVVGIMDSFRSIGGSQSTQIYSVAKYLGESLTTTLLGLAVSVAATFCYKHLRGEMEVFDIEMENASVGVVNSLLPHVARLPIPVTKQLPAVSAYEYSPADGSPAISYPVEQNWLAGLVWPSLESANDAESALSGGMCVCFVYGVIAWLMDRDIHRLTDGTATLLFFAFAGLGIKAGSTFAIASVLSYLIYAVADFSVTFRWLFGSFVLALSPLLLIGSWRAVRFLAASGEGAANPMESAGLLRLRRTWTKRPLLMAALTVALGCYPMQVSFDTPLVSVYSMEGDRSMEPSLHAGEEVFCLKGPLIGPVRRDDLVLVSFGPAVGIARVVGLPGDRVQIDSGRLIRNGRQVAEPYVEKSRKIFAADFPGTPYGSKEAEEPFVVPPDSYFVLNDDRNENYDSRTFGVLHEQEILGRPILVYTPDASPSGCLRRVW